MFNKLKFNIQKFLGTEKITDEMNSLHAEIASIRDQLDDLKVTYSMLKDIQTTITLLVNSSSNLSTNIKSTLSNLSKNNDARKADLEKINDMVKILEKKVTEQRTQIIEPKIVNNRITETTVILD